MNCTELVARSAHASDQTVVTSTQAAGAALIFRQQDLKANELFDGDAKR
jgi:hypothetical protein